MFLDPVRSIGIEVEVETGVEVGVEAEVGGGEESKGSAI